MTLFYPGEQAPLIVSNIPEGAQVTFTSENASVATVTSSGTITAVGSGTTTVRAEVSGTKLECIVRCKLDSSAESGADVDAEGCTLSHSDVTMAFLGEYFKISLKDADGNRVKGLSWKSGVAAEVIGIPDGSIGEKLFMSKIYLETADLFAWTLVVILLSFLCEKLFIYAVKLVQKRVEKM